MSVGQYRVAGRVDLPLHLYSLHELDLLGRSARQRGDIIMRPPQLLRLLRFRAVAIMTTSS